MPRNPQFRKLNRAVPKLPVEAMTTYSIKAPLTTHFRRATCAESGCVNYLRGWRVRLEPLTEDLRAQIKASGKKFTKQEVSAEENWLVFEAGQECFDGDAGRHKVRIARPELFVVRDGDWRGSPRGERRTHTGFDNWFDDMNTTWDKVVTRVAQG